MRQIWKRLKIHNVNYQETHEAHAKNVKYVHISTVCIYLWIDWAAWWPIET